MTTEHDRTSFVIMDRFRICYAISIWPKEADCNTLKKRRNSLTSFAVIAELLPTECSYYLFELFNKLMWLQGAEQEERKYSSNLYPCNLPGAYTVITLHGSFGIVFFSLK